MGMYTECILGCRLKENVPADVLETLNFMFREFKAGEPAQVPWPNSNHPTGERCNWMLHSGGSCYFGAPSGDRTLQPDGLGVRLSARFNIKNYDNEIESFLEWLRPHIQQGSGTREFFAIVTYEEQAEPTIYYLDNPVEN